MIVSLKCTGAGYLDGIGMRQWYQSGDGSVADCLPQTHDNVQSAYNLGRISAAPARHAVS